MERECVLSKATKDILGYLGWNEFFHTCIGQDKITPDLLGVTLSLPPNKSDADLMKIFITDEDKQLYTVQLIQNTEQKESIICRTRIRVFGPKLRTVFEEETGIVAPVQQERKCKVEKELNLIAKVRLASMINKLLEYNKWGRIFGDQNDNGKQCMHEYKGALNIATSALIAIYSVGGKSVEKALTQLAEYWDPHSGFADGIATLNKFEEELEKVTGEKPKIRDILTEVRIYEED